MAEGQVLTAVSDLPLIVMTLLHLLWRRLCSVQLETAQLHRCKMAEDAGHLSWLCLGILEHDRCHGLAWCPVCSSMLQDRQAGKGQQASKLTALI